MLLPTAAAGQVVTGGSALRSQQAPLLLSPGVPVGSFCSCSLGAAAWKPLIQVPYRSRARGLPPPQTFPSSAAAPHQGRCLCQAPVGAAQAPSCQSLTSFAKLLTTASALQLRFFKRKIRGSAQGAGLGLSSRARVPQVLLLQGTGAAFGNTQRSGADLWSRGLCSLPTGSLGGSTGMAGFTAPPPCHAPPVGSVPAEAGCGHAAQRLACVLPQRVGRKRALGALRRAAACALRGGDKGSKSTSGEHGHGPGFVQPGRKKQQQQGRDWGH